MRDELIIRAEMLIRKPVQQVYDAFIDPAVTSKFWFTRGSGKLEKGRTVEWHWDMYGAAAEVEVVDAVPNERIVIDWGTKVEWTFTPQSESMTFVTITNSGFQGGEDEIVNQAIDAKEGFTIVLCGLKAYLEHGIELNLVADKAPHAHIKAE
ncbi:SRPBCC family protein [Paenibacillus kobensis]|uniref:SRPBCC family protein n=1 Tax=Paenibacillus kobensis TaxID=59841 RepID=UPI000FD6E448|nr:SRPBCC family protein [Paenibacillus kobensis]